ncbi:MAG: GNAT family N-acetyltransferase [Nanoarchaeota archaeon]|nr:GNAT family N-acetyltransferase [Nanoarchaeota archaeon]MBU4300062.1 GNAT family N-acetyltransferase [Nanoarchaeota archaeon]MBU4451863.1 GNAT family N-acetyltransferase [Nanoarchaeota archaeon]MCG2724401.1 GNAT family N-acetyltransferase [archaeon]
MQLKDFGIRPIITGDIPRVVLLIEQCVFESCRTVYDADELSYWASLYSEEKFCEYTQEWNFWVLCDKNAKIKGCVGIYNNVLKGLFVEPSCQGVGFGKKLLEFAESYAKEKGVKKIILDASPNAVRFYEKNGYYMLGKRLYATGIQNGCLNVMRMEKNILH